MRTLKMKQLIDTSKLNHHEYCEYNEFHKMYICYEIKSECCKVLRAKKINQKIRNRERAKENAEPVKAHKEYKSLSKFDRDMRMLRLQRISEGGISLNMRYADKIEELLVIYQLDNKYYLKPLWLRKKEISESEFREITDTVAELFGEGWEGTAGTELTYDEFWEKYYNNHEAEGASNNEQL
jgi:hypothetical protein